MSRERVINTLIDTDLYKLTMGQAVLHNHPQVEAGYKFINRGETMFPAGFGYQLEEQVEMMAGLQLDREQIEFLKRSCPYLSADYLKWLRDYRFDPSEVSIRQVGGRLDINIDGPWSRTIYWEVPLMATISELYFKNMGQVPDDKWRERCQTKAETFRREGIKYTDFGTRRRFSHQVHEGVVNILKNNGGLGFLGTSNVEMSMRFNLKPVGTYAHEWVMGQAGIYGVEEANKKAMELWQNEFDGRLSTALTDTFTTEVFLRSYDKERALKFKTLRQDSGLPEKWTDQVVFHLRSNLNLESTEFSALYSDSLSPDRVLEINNYAKGKIRALFGIGTNLTNDVGVKPLNMVIKMFYISKPEAVKERVSVAKLSDDRGKTSGVVEMAEEYRQKLAIKNESVG